MATGIELIANERQEQIEKHKFSTVHDIQHSNKQLETAALYALSGDLGAKWALVQYGNWTKFLDKIRGKNKIERLAIAGALIAAEIDRLRESNNGK